nr:hypothetical protein [uncultured Psychrobacter sp.]
MTESNKKQRRRPIVVELKQKLNEMPVEERDDFADKCGTSFDNLRQIAYGWGGCSISLAQSIVTACDGEVELEDLIPELKKHPA